LHGQKGAESPIDEGEHDRQTSRDTTREKTESDPCVVSEKKGNENRKGGDERNRKRVQRTNVRERELGLWRGGGCQHTGRKFREHKETTAPLKGSSRK